MARGHSADREAEEEAVIEAQLKAGLFPSWKGTESLVEAPMTMEEEQQYNKEEVQLIIDSKFGGRKTLGNKILAQAIQRNRAKKRSQADPWPSMTLMQQL